jgi:PKD repeat protein
MNKSYFYPLFLLVTVVYLMQISCSKDNKDFEKAKNEPPKASIYATPLEGYSPLNVEFVSWSSDPEDGILIHHWNFGDGEVATTMNASHTYTKSGTYTVALTVTDDKGLTDVAYTTITVGLPPDLFPVSKNAQWVYRVKSTKSNNGRVVSDETGLIYFLVDKIDNSNPGYQIIDLKVTGKRYFNKSAYPNKIKILHFPGQSISLHHGVANESYGTFLDLSKTNYNEHSFFFRNSSGNPATRSSVNVSIGLGTFESYRIRYHTDNWGENHVSERYDITEMEYFNPKIGLLYREKSSLVNFVTCFTCPAYGFSEEIELIGYYIPQEDGTIIKGGTSYDPDNPYGGEQGLLTIFTKANIGVISVDINNEYEGSIQYYHVNGVNCGDEGALNIYRPAGTYSLHAKTSGATWSANVTFTKGVCSTIELTE